MARELPPHCARGLTHRSSVNRAKSVSAEHNETPCSRARAARCASGMRSEVGRCRVTSWPSTSACASVGAEPTPPVCPSQSLTHAHAASPDTGAGRPADGFGCAGRPRARGPREANAHIAVQCRRPASSVRGHGADSTSLRRRAAHWHGPSPGGRTIQQVLDMPDVRHSIRTPPSETRWAKTVLEGWLVKPRRASSLTAALTPKPRSRRNRATAAATFSSSVTVVRMLKGYILMRRTVGLP